MLTTLKKIFSSRAESNELALATFNDTPAITTENSEDSAYWQHIDQTFIEMLLGVKSLISGQISNLERSSLATMHKQYLQNTMPEHLVPRLPAIIPKLMLALRDSDSNASDLAELLSGDVALVSDVIQLANSAYYSRSQFYDSLEQAIVNIGFSGIRQIIVGAAMKPILNTSSGHFSSIASNYLWDKSLYAGQISDCAAKKMREDRFHAYLASLTMQSGMTMLSRELDKHFSPDNAPRDRQFVDAMNCYALEISARISQQWQFPQAVSSALREQLATDNVSKMSTLGGIIFIADKQAKTKLLMKNGYLKTFDTNLSGRIPADMAAIFSDYEKQLDNKLE